ncbi:MAG: helix-turn-helix domain-containing protein [Isosphaeraceae bacterium]
MEYKTGPALRRLRLQSRMPIQEVAALTGLGVTKLSSFERGFSPPPEPHVVEAMLTKMGQTTEIPELLAMTARERGAVQLELANATREAVDLSIELARRFRRGLSATAARRIRKALATS